MLSNGTNPLPKDLQRISWTYSIFSGAYLWYRKAQHRWRYGLLSAYVASYRQISVVISLLLSRLLYASDWLFGHVISEQNLLPFVLDFSFYIKQQHSI
jgi:hypothetical protein